MKSSAIGRSDKRTSRVADARVKAIIKEKYLKPYRPSIRMVWRDVVKLYEQSNEPPPSYTFVAGVVKEIDPDIVARYRVGEREWNDRHALVQRALRSRKPASEQKPAEQKTL